MPFNGTGTFTTVAYPNYPAQAGTTIKASMFNTNITDLVNGLTNCLTRDGQSPPTANLPMAGKKHTGVAAATNADEYARYDQILSPSLGGTISVNTATPALKITQAGAGYALYVEDQTSDPSPFCIDAAGLVGVATPTPRQSFSLGAYLDMYVGAVNAPAVPSIRATATDLFLNAYGTGRVNFNSDSGVNAVTLPFGTTASRPAAPSYGDTRINSTLGKPEWYNGSGWAAMGGGATGGGSDDAFYENTQTIGTSYTLTTGKNAMTAGPVSISNAVVVTIPDGATWTVV